MIQFNDSGAQAWGPVLDIRISPKDDSRAETEGLKSVSDVTYQSSPLVSWYRPTDAGLAHRSKPELGA